MQMESPVAGAGKYVIFVLGEEEYGVAVERVREIIGPLPVTRVPRMPESVLGVINLRGKIVPVVDLRIRFGLEPVDHGRQTCMIVVETAAAEFAVMVDRVSEVATVGATDIDDAPHFGSGIETDYLLGVAKYGSRVRLLLDIERALSEREVAALERAADIGTG